MSILKTSICGVEFKNPVITSSGTFGFGTEYNRYYDVSKLGGICLKGLTLKARQGNPPKRIAETPMGILNSVGLQNPGVETFCKNMLPFIRKFDTNLIANISGNTIEEYCEMVEILSDSSINMIEMNISCPNVKKGGLNFGTDPKMVEEITSEVKKHCKKPLIVKLTPNVTDITEIAKSAESGGADALSLINTLLGMKIDINTRRPVLYNNMGGLSGPCIKPVAVRMVWQVRNACKLPIIGMGGISNWEDAVEFMMAGADIVSVGTANFIDPFAPLNIVSGLEEYVKKNNLESISEIVGTVIPNGK